MRIVDLHCDTLYKHVVEGVPLDSPSNEVLLEGGADDRKLQPDSLTVPRNVLSDMERPRKMSMSLYPVQLQVHGRLLRIQSDHNQILPIYTQSGAFYMVMRLNKGTNWLSGLPRGRYFINNRIVSIGL